MNAERDWHYRYGPKNGIEVENMRHWTVTRRKEWIQKIRSIRLFNKIGKEAKKQRAAKLSNMSALPLNPDNERTT